MRKLTIAVLLLSATFFTQASITEHKFLVYFNTAEHQLSSEAQLQLEQVIKKSRKCTDYEIIINGHTDNIGANDYNQQLSLRRTNSVRDYLTTFGRIDKDYISSHFFGEDNPAFTNKNENSRGKNRRVEVRLLAYNFESKAEILRALQSKQNPTFIVPAGEGALLEGRQGIRLEISSKTFLTSEGKPVNEDVEVELVEAITFKDFIAYGLATVSQNKQLESGGMCKIEAQTVSGKKVQIAGDFPIKVTIPTSEYREEMELFTSKDGRDWTETNQPVINKLESQKVGNQKKMRARPRLKYVNYPMPQFRVDLKSKPKKPSQGYMPREPIEPRRESYKRSIKWYQILNRQEHEEKEEARYQNAMQTYEAKMELYEHKMQRYQQRMTNFHCVLEEYQENLSAWEAEQDQRRENFYASEEYQIAEKMKRKLQAVEDAKYERAMTAWKKERADELDQEIERRVAKGTVDQELINKYVFNCHQLSWINVDRFYKQQMNNTKDILANCDDNAEKKVFLIFPEMNSLIEMSKLANGNYQRKTIPKNVPAEIFAFRVDHGKPSIAISKVSGNRTDVNLDFSPCSFVALRGYIERYNS